MAARPRIPDRQHDVGGQLVFNVEVELLNSALLEIEILRLNCACEIVRVQRRRNRGEEPLLNAAVSAPQRAGIAWEKIEIIRLSEVRWVLPQSLRALVPRRIVEYRIPRAHRRCLAAEGLPGQSDPGLQGSLVQL